MCSASVQQSIYCGTTARLPRSRRRSGVLCWKRTLLRQSPPPLVVKEVDGVLVLAARGGRDVEVTINSVVDEHYCCTQYSSTMNTVYRPGSSTP